MRRTSPAAAVTLLAVGLAACDTSTTSAPEEEHTLNLSIAQGATKVTDLTPGSFELAQTSTVGAVHEISNNGNVAVVDAPGTQASLFEDYEGSNTGSIAGCTGPLDTNTNDACYSPGELVEGISMDNLDSGFDPSFGVVAVAPFLFGIPSTTVGPNFFVDDTVLEIGYGGAPNVVFSVYAPFGQCWLRLWVYDGNGLIGLFAIQTGSGSGAARYSVTAFGTTITRLELTSPDNCIEFVDDIEANS